MKAGLIRNMLMGAALLAGFGGLGTSLVIATYEATKEQIEASEKANLLKNLNNILPADSYTNNLLENKLVVPPDSLLGQDKPVTIYQAWKDEQPVAVAFSVIAHDGYSGDIRLLIAIKASGQISGVRVISHKETPGLGDKIELAKDDWILSFNEKSINEPDNKLWKVKKDGGVFDQFTGATITPRAVVKAVYKALDYYNYYQNKLFLTQEQYDKPPSKQEIKP
jgi:electron transport complex protein RnfG